MQNVISPRKGFCVCVQVWVQKKTCTCVFLSVPRLWFVPFMLWLGEVIINAKTTLAFQMPFFSFYKINRQWWSPFKSGWSRMNLIVLCPLKYKTQPLLWLSFVVNDFTIGYFSTLTSCTCKVLLVSSTTFSGSDVTTTHHFIVARGIFYTHFNHRLFYINTFGSFHSVL